MKNSNCENFPNYGTCIAIPVPCQNREEVTVCLFATKADYACMHNFNTKCIAVLGNWVQEMFSNMARIELYTFPCNLISTKFLWIIASI